MAKVVFELRKAKLRSDGKVAVYLLVRHKKERARLATDVWVRPRDWHELKLEVRKSHGEGYVDLNRTLRRLRDMAERELDRVRADGRDMRPVAIRAAISETHERRVSDFTAFMDEHVRHFEARSQVNTQISYNKIRNKLIAYALATTGRETIHFEDLTVRWVKGFISWCRESRGNSQNTASKAGAILRTFIRAAIDENLMSYEQNPFNRVRLTWTQSMKDRMAIDDIRVLESVALEDPKHREARDLFVFAFYSWGKRFADMARMRWVEIEKQKGETFVRYQMQKTGGVRMLPLSGPALDILDRCEDRRPNGLVFNVLKESHFSGGKKAFFQAINGANTRTNKRLKSVARIAKMEPFSFHVARHSMADHLLASGYTVREISSVFGHASTKVTERYLQGLGRTGLEDRLRDLF